MSKLSEYVKKAKEKKTSLGEVMERRKNRKLQQLEEAEIDAAIAEAKSKILESQTTQQPLQPGQAQNFASLLLAGRPPQEVKEILGSLTREEMDNFAYMASTMNNTNLANFRGFLRQPTTGSKEILEAVKTGVEVAKPPLSSGSSAKEVLEAVKLGLEVGKAQKPVESAPKESPMKLAMEYIKPFYEVMSEKDRQFYQAQIQNVQSQIVDPIAYLEKIKEVAPSLGFVSASQGKGPNLELEKMHIDHDRWKYEQEYKQRKEYQEMQNKRASEKERTKLIRDIAIPALKKMGPAIDAAVKAGQRKIAGVGTGRTATKQVATGFLCPECAKEGVETIIDVSSMPDVAKCPKCGREFPKKT